MTDLAYLSLQRVTGHRRPIVPSNDERMRAFRAATPALFANAQLNDQLRAIEYARQACADARVISLEDYEQ